MQTEFKLAVVGSRTFTDYKLLSKTLDEIESKKTITQIISGGAVGADSFANKWAKDNGKPILIIYPRWYNKKGFYDKGAGFKRNLKIVDACDAVVAFTNGSKGTAHTIDAATSMGKRVKIVSFMEPQTYNAHTSVDIENSQYTLSVKDNEGQKVFSKSDKLVGDITKLNSVGLEIKSILEAINWAKSKSDKLIIYYNNEIVYKWVKDLFSHKDDNWEPDNKFARKYREYVCENLTYIEKYIKVEKDAK